MHFVAAHKQFVGQTLPALYPTILQRLIHYGTAHVQQTATTTKLWHRFIPSKTRYACGL